jgi:hypothetical protein
VTIRRIPMLVLAVLALAVVVTTARDTVAVERALFSPAATGWMPSAPTADRLTESWFCPGVPATGVEGVEGSVVIVNRSPERRVGSVLVYNETAENRRLALDLDPWASSFVDLDLTLPGAMVGALVEVEGGGVLVEQQSSRPSGNSSAACANATSDAWFLADGSTAEGSIDQIVLSNPYDQTVVASLEFATREGPRAPGSYSGLTVPARSVRVIDLGAPGAGAQGEPILAVSVQASRGRLVVGRSQWFLGGGRLGTQVTLASPTPRSQWWFSNGDQSEGTVERYAIYNPSDDDAEVDVIVLGVDVPFFPEPIVVPSRQVVVFDPSEVADFPTGDYSIVLSTLAEESIVVERATTQVLDDEIGTSVIAGAVSRPDGYYANSWYVVQAPARPTAQALAIHNADNGAGTVTVSVIGSSGPVPVPGLTDVPLGAAQRIELDLTDPLVLGRPLLVDATNRVFVEQWFPTGRGDLRVASWAIPVG